MSWTTVADVAAAACLLAGSLLSLAAAVGLVRFPDLFTRMHAATKPQVLGLLLVLVGVELRLRSGEALGVLALVALFQFLTAPVSAHMVGRAAYRLSPVRRDLLIRDELAERDARRGAEGDDVRDGGQDGDHPPTDPAPAARPPA